MNDGYAALVRRGRRFGYDIAIQTRSVTGFPVTAAWSWALTRRGAEARAQRMVARRTDARPAQWRTALVLLVVSAVVLTVLGLAFWDALW